MRSSRSEPRRWSRRYPRLVEPADDALEDDESVVAGEGDTIETGAVELDDDGVVDVDEDAVVLVDDDDSLEDVAGAGLGLSLCTPLANGLRAMRASTTLTGSAGRTPCVVAVCAVEVVAAARRRRRRRGGAGGCALEQQHGDGDESHDQERDDQPQLALQQISTKRAHPCPPVVVPDVPAVRPTGRSVAVSCTVRLDEPRQGHAADAQQRTGGVDRAARDRDEIRSSRRTSLLSAM